MAKVKVRYVCQECGYETARWMGKCPNCDSWNSLVEEKNVPAPTTAKEARVSRGASIQRLSEISDHDDSQRITSGIEELDRVLGGGLVKGSAVLLGGDPGIGKSTLLLQLSQTLSETMDVVYVSGEESAAQLKMRAKRLGGGGEQIRILCETDLDEVERKLEAEKPQLVIIDSIQTMMSAESAGTAGSISQVRNATSALTRLAKITGACIVIVGHVTKQGSIAGPKVLEHLVDTVLYFEGDRYDSYRVLRAVKNRFGSTNEIGVFEMSELGMQEVSNPSALFLSQRENALPGCAVLCTLEGSRSLLAEVQALCAYTSFGTPRRTSAGIDYNRMALLCAVLEKKLGLRLQDQDIYVNVVGGLRIDERCADLAVIAAIVSSLRDCAIRPGTVAVGEVGLTGEVRGATQALKRAQECARLGFSRMVLPRHNARGISVSGLEIVGVGTVEEALNALLQ